MADALGRWGSESIDRERPTGFMSRAKRLQAELEKIEAAVEETPRCALCDRPVPPTARQSEHHLVPKSRGGTFGPKVLLHQICHNVIHALFSEKELGRRLSDIDALRSEPEIAAFITWIRTKPDDFYAPTRRAKARR